MINAGGGAAGGGGLPAVGRWNVGGFSAAGGGGLGANGFQGDGSIGIALPSADVSNNGWNVYTGNPSVWLQGHSSWDAISANDGDTLYLGNQNAVGDSGVCVVKLSGPLLHNSNYLINFIVRTQDAAHLLQPATFILFALRLADGIMYDSTHVSLGPANVPVGGVWTPLSALVDTSGVGVIRGAPWSALPNTLQIQGANDVNYCMLGYTGIQKA